MIGLVPARFAPPQQEPARSAADVDAIANSVDGKFMSAFIRATKPQIAGAECCAPTHCK
jgi:hypothetical protein